MAVRSQVYVIFNAAFYMFVYCFLNQLLILKFTRRILQSTGKRNLSKKVLVFLKLFCELFTTPLRGGDISHRKLHWILMFLLHVFFKVYH